jgi:excisionase family DNA binding protein
MDMNKEPQFYSLEQVAERLGLHVRTVRGYVRGGSLNAVRIGKQYRVTREDLEAITGQFGPRRTLARHRSAEVSSVIQVDAVSQEMAGRITNHLLGAVKTPRHDGSALRVDAIYDQGHAQMKVIVIGSLSVTAHIFGLLDVILEA